MGCCVSKKATGSSSTVSAIPTTAAGASASHSSSSVDTRKLETQIQVQKKKVQQQQVEEIKEVQEVKKTEAGGEDTIVKKEVFVIKHRKSHDKERPMQIEDEVVCNVGKVRTSSCSKEEVDAILIQCGRMSRSNSSGNANSSGGKKYSGSKRSYDFDVEEVKGSDEGDGEEKRQHRQRERRHNRPSSSSPSGRRRTPSRERDLNQQQQRSGSRERSGVSGGGSSSRRVSRSPGRRSDTNNANANANSNGAMGTANRPGKMVSVPPTVSTSSLERRNNGGESAAIKRISVKRNVGGEAAARGVASPRSQSPARVNAKENQQQPSLSRSSSRKAEQSPYRRNPLSEIDPNSLAYPQPSIDKAPGSNNYKCKEIEAEVVLNQKQNQEMNNDRVVGQGNNHKKGNRGTQNMKDVSANCLVKEQQQIVEEAKRQTTNITTTTTVIPAGTESLKPQTVTRSRSSRRSRDLDINPEALLNAEPSYTTLLLEDIQNFHQKNTNTNANTNTPSFSLPACVSKACSILEAVADLNSTTSSNLSCALSDDRRGLPIDQSSSNKAGYTFVGKKASAEPKDPFIESEVVVNDDLMEPSFHKYVTVRRGGTLGEEEEDMDEQESSGSNSFSGNCAQQNWGMSSSSWEPSSVDSAGCGVSRFKGREEDHINAPAFQRQGFSESDRAMDEARRGVSGKRNRGIGRNMVVSGDGFLATTPVVAATASM